jgi:Spy/CpxP family protein refolding chaperone
MHTFPPELVMQNQQAIGLSEEQRDAIKAEIQRARTLFTDLEWDLQNEMEAFNSLISQDKVNEEKALAVLEKVLTHETKIKKTHLTLAIRIKNLLSAEQQAQLREIRDLRGIREMRMRREMRERRERMEQR